MKTTLSLIIIALILALLVGYLSATTAVELRELSQEAQEAPQVPYTTQQATIYAYNAIESQTDASPLSPTLAPLIVTNS